MKKLTIAVVAATLALSACTETDPNTGEVRYTKAAKGAGLGAVAGAVLGAVIGSDSSKDALRGAAIGAGIGALAGGGVGYYMDQQEKKMREALADSDVDVRRNGDQLLLTMPGNVTFATDSSNVSGNFTPVLNEIADVLTEFEQTTIQVVGHTDSTGSDNYNQALSERRAASVANELRYRGVIDARMATGGMGEYRPVATNDTAQGRSQNRRVEIEIDPIVAPRS